MARQQTEADIKNLSGLSAIREKVSMYLGSSDGSAMFTALREVLDNAVDEASQGRNNYLHLLAVANNPLAFYIIDHGGGMPIGNILVENPITQKKERISALKALVGLTHTGGKYDAKTEDGGLRGVHGVGIKATNAVSTKFSVTTKRENKWYYTEYSKGKEVVEVSDCRTPKLPNGESIKKGTVVYIELDPTVFDKGSKLDTSEILAWFTMTSAFAEGIELYYTDIKGKEHSYACEGSEAYIQSMLTKLKANTLTDNSMCHIQDKFYDLTLAFTDYDGQGVEGYSNGLLNKDGGAHVTAVYNAVSYVVRDYAKRGHSFNPSDLREGLVGAVNLKLTGIKFHNQEKSKVVDERAFHIEDSIVEHLQAFFKKNKQLAYDLCDRASQVAKLKSEFQQSKRVLKVIKDAQRGNRLPAKLASSPNCTAEEREIFIVEGDSAGGSIKRARNSSYQEVLPLRGKMANPYTMRNPTDAMESEEILNLLIALGYKADTDNPFSDLRANKIIILTDPDVDGLHITNLLIANINAFLPQLINEGKIYCCIPYEFMVETSTGYVFAETKAELQKLVDKRYYEKFTHIKGWGEVDAEVLADMACNPEKRRLIQLQPINKKGRERIASLAGSDSSARKALLGV